MWKSTVKPDRPQVTMWCIRIAFWILKATNTHSEYIILIAFPLRKWLHEPASVLLYTSIAVLLNCYPRLRKIPLVLLFLTMIFF